MLAAIGGLAVATVLWGWFEAGWVRLAERDLEVPGLPAELDGLRIGHLSDFHLGVPSRGERASARGVAWVAEQRPDLVCITGDLLSRRRGLPRLRALLEQLDHPYVVLGNHDRAQTRDPFSRAGVDWAEPVSGGAGLAGAGADSLELGELTRGELLADTAVELERRGRRIELAGVDPRSWLAKRRSGFAPSDAGLRILLCHFPRALETVGPGRFHLILAGHIHAGQIVLPYGFGRLVLAHPRTRYLAGVYRRGGTVMHVSPGLGTTFVPFRLFARPEATILTLRA